MDTQQAASSIISSAPGTPEMRAVLCADLVDSTALVERMGDIPGADLMRRHDRIARDLLQRHGGQEIDKTDGFLLLFGRALDAVAFALAYQRALAGLSREVGQSIKARVGIHLGEVILWQNMASDVAQGAKPTEVEGLAKPVAARLMGLARPGQILLSGSAFNLAQRASGELPASASPLRWLTHGRYQFKGVPQPQLVHEVGEPGIAPLRAPASGPKARRDAPFWRRPMALVIEAVAAAAVLAIALGVLLRPTPVIAFAERDWVVLGDLQNRTSEPNFSGALDAALRIGLEQSRFVNVVPNLQVQDALRRMEKPGQAVDRDVGVELAMREGARALLLPSLSESGRLMRFSIEVVDPSSGVTVRVETANAATHDELLPAMDQTLAALRETLGESLTDIQQSSAPLAKITASNLEALRAYSKVEPAIAEGRLPDALALLELAVSLDPGFAIAHAKLGIYRKHVLGDHAAARADLNRAIAQAERISLRERLMVERALAEYGTAQQVREKSILLAELFPDMAAARHNLGLAELFWMYDPLSAVPHFQAVADSSHPRRGESLMALSLAMLQLGKAEEAQKVISQARSLGARAQHGQDLLIDLAAGDHAKVLESLQKLPSNLPELARESFDYIGVAVLVDQGRLDEAERALQETLARNESEWTRSKARADLARLALRADQRSIEITELDSFATREFARMQADSHHFDRSPELNLSVAALLAARMGYSDYSAKWLDAIEPAVNESGRLPQISLHATARCLQLPQQEQTECLGRTPKPHMYQADIALWDSAKASAADNLVDSQGLVLARSRGRAITETENLDLLVPNLLDERRFRNATNPVGQTLNP